ncbi:MULTISPECIES: DNA cytosine methyltransferase [unclassified Pseudomonas]|uniref:DNA cytosine methyltransferase n=1 Tax=unclassified Pseudomonas TaxID=196821 RepID=UPI000B846968|nr:MULTISPECIES: DNA cytosine methyltransferase [unclassified Pseudomonas]
MNELALFAGAGGGVLGGHLLGWRTVCAVERDAYAAQVLAQRQNDGALPPFPIWSEVCSFDGRPWRGLIDVVSGGFPCQDISSAGSGGGIDGARSGLWRQMARIIREVRPRFVYVENSPMLVGRGLAVVLGDLAEMGYDARWGIVGAADLGALHQRDRIWIVANANGTRQSQPTRCEQERGLGIEQCSEALDNAERERQHQRGADYQQHVGHQPRTTDQHPGALANANGDRQHSRCVTSRQATQIPRAASCGCDVADSTSQRLQQMEQPEPCRAPGEGSTDPSQYTGLARRWPGWPTEPSVGRVADGVAHRVDRIRALGNGQVPRVAAAAFILLTERVNSA